MSDLIAYVDGGSHGSPGPSGIGVLIEKPDGEMIRIARWIGHHDNNVAEYAALLEALQRALELNATSLSVFTRFRAGGETDDRRVLLPQPAALLSPLDVPQAGPHLELLHLPHSARTKPGSQPPGEPCGAVSA